MRNFAKRLIPTSLVRRLRRERVRQNRRSIARTARQHSRVCLVPDNVVEHYYHFLFDLCVPLFLLVESTPEHVQFVVQTSGPFLPRVNQLFSRRVAIADTAGDPAAPKRVLLGMNPFLVDVTGRELLAFSRHVRHAVGAQDSEPAREVLLIERLPPQEFFRTAASSRGGGASRRHIPNHEAVMAAVQSAVQAPYQFQNVRLEEMTFEAQIQLFARAALVIGQHGAGLANCLWMKPGGTVIELTNDPEKSHFQTLSQKVGHRHVLQRTAGAHDPVDVNRMATLLRTEWGGSSSA